MSNKTGTPKSADRPESKQSVVLNMLRSKSGATLPALMQATGWQAHSVRSFFSAVVRKKLQLDLTSDGEGDKRVYRLAPEPSATTSRGSKRRARA